MGFLLPTFCAAIVSRLLALLPGTPIIPPMPFALAFISFLPSTLVLAVFSPAVLAALAVLSRLAPIPRGPRASPFAPSSLAPSFARAMASGAFASTRTPLRGRTLRIILDEGTPEARRVGGPLWTIFDADYAASEGFNCAYPDVDTENGYFFSGDTIEELAQNIVNKYHEDYLMDPQMLVDTVNRYNELVDKGTDGDFGKPDDEMTKKIETGPFYAA